MRPPRSGVDSGLVDVLMCGISLVQRDGAEVEALCAACVEADIGLAAMKPFHGGTLLNCDGRQTGITPVQRLAHTLSRPVATTVPGARRPEELRAALCYLEASDPEKEWPPAIPLMHEGLAGHCVAATTASLARSRSTSGRRSCSWALRSGRA